ncbi:helix-turn-helix domain-containing protein [Streptomyces alkaliterrae]|uniref:Helix-turn-helix domain-containing protein n=2 Tax=Streptomyces alkaliterrae TaxID=2213162 RepID=A0A5P0YYN6_9ACTN|nr:helix-turn-helix transcriptional regulator [Streptomyces alkaliterrae]MBB1259017.1 helix-turn-helix transcriptional regulator [Streptomyces alkaliterrae]MQS04642.1 helix-turn-helix domain-containing protein [Streptomyces alkaliterrae]
MRLVGAQLAQLRRNAGLTQERLAERVNAEYDTIASIEQGRRPLKRELAVQLDEVLNTGGVLTIAVDNMPEMDKYPIWAAEFVDREAEAVAISSYENQVLPGLLQTPEYARSVFENEIPCLSQEEIEQRVSARIERQVVLRRESPVDLSFVISEAVLMDRLGGEEVWRGTLQHLRECADLPGVTIQIMPFGRTTHAGISGPFVLLETADHEHIAYMETQRGSQLVSEPSQVSVLARKYAMLRTQALDVEETRDLMDRRLGET